MCDHLTMKPAKFEGNLSLNGEIVETDEDLADWLAMSVMNLAAAYAPEDEIYEELLDAPSSPDA